MSEKPLISFDYAIKYLLRNKGDYDIIEGFISALLAMQGYKPVKINAILDGESNKETADLKKSIADLVVEDTDGNKYMVEIERALTPNFMHKACFNSSRLVIDSIYGNQDYTAIKKVFHISLLYVSPKEMNKPIYHGQTIIHEIDTAHPIDMRIANQGLMIYEHHNVFPEYFFISVPSFNNIINSEIDEWLYVMRNCDVRDDFKSPYMKKVAERLSILKMSKEERDNYIYYMKKAIHYQDTLTAAEIKGKIEGIEKGKEIGKIEGIEEGKEIGKIEGIEEGKRAERYTTVLKMLKLSMSIEDIQAVTDFTKEEIEDISKENNNSEE